MVPPRVETVATESKDDRSPRAAATPSPQEGSQLGPLYQSPGNEPILLQNDQLEQELQTEHSDRCATLQIQHKRSHLGRDAEGGDDQEEAKGSRQEGSRRSYRSKRVSIVSKDVNKTGRRSGPEMPQDGDDTEAVAPVQASPEVDQGQSRR